MFGHITQQEALDRGFTHHGRYYFLPIYYGEQDGVPMVSVKNILFDFVFDIIFWFECRLVTDADIPKFTVGLPLCREEQLPQR